MGAEAVNSWFTPFHYIVYLGVPFVMMIAYLQWRWAKTCKENIQVLVAEQGGGGSFQLAPKTGGEVSLKNPNNNSIRTWPINELSSIDVLYPGVGFVPAFMQKTIRMVIVNEGDWEPMLNRSPHKKRIASPDIVDFLKSITESDSVPIALKNKILLITGEISTGPTREMIASPAVLGNLINERITEAVMTINKEVMDSLSGVIRKMSKLVNPTIVYIGLGLIAILLVYVVFQMTQIGDMIDGVERIQQALGVTTPVK